jgi:hypothetical protein
MEKQGTLSVARSLGSWYLREIRRTFLWMIGLGLGLGLPAYFLGAKTVGITLAVMGIVYSWALWWFRWRKGQ